MATPSDTQEFQSAMRQLDRLLQEVDRIDDPAARDRTAEIIQGLMEFHGAGLRRILECLSRAGDRGREIIDQLAQDELTGSLLLLYDLHPTDLPSRVEAALEKVRPYLASHGGNVELLGISADRVIRLALRGSCHGCASSTATMKTTIEQAIYDKAPDAAAIEVEGTEEPRPAASGGFVPIEQLTARSGKNSLTQGVAI